MSFYSVKLGMDASAKQPELILLFKNSGGDVIQTSDGLCVKSELKLAALTKLLEEKELAAGVAVSEVDASSASPDVRAFMGAT
jgi:hypothetical protein